MDCGCGGEQCVTRNAWQRLACSPPGLAVSPLAVVVIELTRVLNTYQRLQYAFYLVNLEVTGRMHGKFLTDVDG